MPVDLTMIGIEGQQAAQQRFESQARVRAMDMNNREAEFKLNQLAREQALADKAGALLNSIAKNDVKTIDDPNEVGQRLTRMSQPLEVVADLYMRSGAPQQGMKFLQAASEIQKRESDIQNDALKARTTRLENITKGAQAVSQYLGVARNQSEWDYGIKQLRAQGIIEPEFIDQMSKMTFDPDVAAYFNEQAMTAKDRAELELKTTAAANKERNDAIRIAQSERRTAIQQAQLKEKIRHNQAVEKNGGSKATPASAPSEADLKSAKRALKTTVFKGVEDGDDFDSAADYVASQAKAMVRDNKNMTWDTAVQRVIIQGQQSGAFGISKERSGLFDFGEPDVTKAKFINPETPIPVPKDKKQLKKGQVYDTPHGKVRWNGTAGIPVE